MRASPLRWGVRVAVMVAVAVAVLALPGGAALHLVVVVVFDAEVTELLPGRGES